MRAPAAIFALLLLAISCRQKLPQEVVYTGKKDAPPAPVLDASIPLLDSGTSEVEFTKRALLTAIADCTLDQYRRLETKTATLAAATGTVAVQRAWREAMFAIEEAELFRFGPAARTTEPGGQGHRDQLYSWPLVSRCTIEEQLVAGTYATPEFPDSRINARGLGAHEYLIFYSGSDNACSGFSRINAEGSWAALSPQELAAKKADYAAAIARDVHSHAQALVRAWDPAAGNFHRELSTAGAGSTTWSSDQVALNAISDAIFYIENPLKDLKLARPLGLSECANDLCPEAFESKYANASLQHLRANLRGFQRIYQGCGENGEGIGFDDWLGAVGAGELAQRMTSALLVAIATADNFQPPIETALITDTQQVWTLYNAVKGLTDLLKADMVTVLNLELPQIIEGDND